MDEFLPVYNFIMFILGAYLIVVTKRTDLVIVSKIIKFFLLDF